MLEKIKEFVELKTGVEDISINSRKRIYTYPRALFYRLAKDTTKYSLEVIGGYVGKGHCEVLNAFKSTFPQAYEHQPIIRQTYHDFIEAKERVKDIRIANVKTYTELIDENFIQKEMIRELNSKKDIEDVNLVDMILKYNDLTEEKKELFLLRTSAILKMI